MQQSKQQIPEHEAQLDPVSLSISAWMDGDDVTLSPDVLNSKDGIEQWQIFHLIGDTLRTPELATARGQTLVARVHAAVAAEPTIMAAASAEIRPQSAVRKMYWLRRYALPGLAMAAAAVSVVWIAQPLWGPTIGSSSSQVAATHANNVVAPSADLHAVRDYISAHRQVAGPSAVQQASIGASR
jgi:sigma-E factor negative regulatory protein RseA